jgi:predicted metalloprotease
MIVKTNFMRWMGRQGSGNVEDRRGIGGPVAVGGGIIGVIALLVNFLLGGNVDPSQIGLPGQGGAQQPQTAEAKAQNDQLAQFVSVVLRETENVWNEVYARQGEDYPEPKLVLFTGQVESACGGATSASGPFYCPGDQKLYIDLSFYDELKNRFGAPGDFAMAYVVAHEVGHHIQTLMGTSQKMARLRSSVSKEEYNRYSVMMELQADYLAGVWAHHVQGKGLLEAGDVDEALRAANAIGDDKLQQEAQGHVVPESFTHGTSEQRMYWFSKGYKTGDISQGDTFNDPSLR